MRLDHDWGYPQMLPMLVLVGVAFALAYGPLTLAATEGVSETEQGLAGGLLYTSFQFGAALGLAVVTIVLVGDGSGVPEIGDYRTALLVPAIMAFAAALAVLPLGRRRPQRAGPRRARPSVDAGSAT